MAPLLRPIIALNIWTFLIEAYMFFTRIPALTKYKVPVSPTMTKDQLNAKIPVKIQMIANNYNHLLEQPTQFYAVALTLAFLGAEKDSGAIALAWAYVVARMAHSLVQISFNNVPVRFALFAGSSLLLLGMTLKAAAIAWSV